eukprot:TRINITY_DN3550_c0_g3_i1.p2 TRINITY_DN3550_c0_g3~~TRINITY_DN3550_c0_g3_i1.p2  ORF type:complete len:277 (+),score=42.90 TRINITY_DN3550_c0_g3_i1:264-1094(+)
MSGGKGEVVVNIDSEAKPADAAEITPTKISNTVTSYVQLIPVIFAAACGVIALFSWLFSFVDLAGVRWCLILGIVVLLGNGTGVVMTFVYGSIGKQLKMFKSENDRLEHTANTLEDQVSNITQENAKLQKSVDSLGATASQLKDTSDKLSNQLKQFDSLSQSMKEASKKLGLNVEDLIEKTTNTFKEMEVLNRRNERILLRRIVQDLEFMDRDVGLTKDEFERFKVRVPKKYHSFLDSVRFEDFAGEDASLDVQEVRKLLDTMLEHVDKQQSEIHG